MRPYATQKPYANYVSLMVRLSSEWSDRARNGQIELGMHEYVYTEFNEWLGPEVSIWCIPELNLTIPSSTGMVRLSSEWSDWARNGQIELGMVYIKC